MKRTEPPEMDREDSPPQHLPDEIVEEIMSRLPVKSLFQFKCVSKSCQSLIGSQRFIRRHLRHSTNNSSFSNHRVITLQTSKRGDIAKKFDLQSLLKDPSIDPSPIANVPTPTVYNNRWRLIVGCCDGLVCILEKSGHVFLWNPTTGISKALPIFLNGEEPHHIVRSGFGWDESSAAYKVFAMVILFNPDGHRLCYKVYSSKTSCWNSVEVGRRYSPFYYDNWYKYCHMAGKFVCGKLHWFDDFKHNIVSFDLKSEEFGEAEPPFKTEDRFYLWLGEIGGCLCAVSDQHKSSCLYVWVLKMESWIKHATIPLGVHPYRPLFGKWGPNGEILLSDALGFYVYYPKDNKVNISTESKKNWVSNQQTHVYAESLVSPLLLHDDQFEL